MKKQEQEQQAIHTYSIGGIGGDFVYEDENGLLRPGFF